MCSLVTLELGRCQLLKARQRILIHGCHSRSYIWTRLKEGHSSLAVGKGGGKVHAIGYTRMAVLRIPLGLLFSPPLSVSLPPPLPKSVEKRNSFPRGWKTGTNRSWEVDPHRLLHLSRATVIGELTGKRDRCREWLLSVLAHYSWASTRRRPQPDGKLVRGRGPHTSCDAAQGPGQL